MASTEDDVVVRLRLKDVARFIADVKSGKLAIDDLEKKISKAGRTAARESAEGGGGFGLLTRSLRGLATWGVRGLVALGAVGSVGIFKATNAASDLNETMSKVQQVFGKSAQAVLNFSKGSDTALGQSRNEALTAAANYGNFFRNLGLTERAAAGMSTQLVKTATDLASFNNASPEEMLEGVSSALAGEYDPLQRYGMAINAAQVQHEAFRMGLAKTAKDMNPTKQAIAAYKLILEQTGKAEGDFTRTRNGLANTSRIIEASFKDLGARVGQMLLPDANRFAVWFRDRVLPALTSAVDQYGPVVLNDIKVGAGFAVTIGQQIIDSISTAIETGDWKPIGTALGTGLRNMLTGGGGAAGGVDWFDIGKKVAGGAVGFVLGFVVALFDPGTWWPVIQKHWVQILIGIATAFPVGKGLGLIGKVLERVPLARALAPMFERAGGLLEKVGGPVWKMVSGIARAFGRAFLRVFPQVGTEIWYWFTRIGEFFTRDGGLQKRIAGAISRSFSRGMEAAFTAVLRFFRRIVKTILDIIKEMGARVGAALLAALGPAIAFIKDTWDTVMGWITGGTSGGGAGQYKQPPGSPNGGSAVQPGPLIMPGMAASGGTVQRPGMTWVGERGPELLNLPTGSKVIPLPRTPEAVGRGPIHVHVMVDKREIAQAVYDDMGDRVARR